MFFCACVFGVYACLHVCRSTCKGWGWSWSFPCLLKQGLEIECTACSLVSLHSRLVLGALCLCPLSSGTTGSHLSPSICVASGKPTCDPCACIALVTEPSLLSSPNLRAGFTMAFFGRREFTHALHPDSGSVHTWGSCLWLFVAQTKHHLFTLVLS